jgi:hypothetical protein
LDGHCGALSEALVGVDLSVDPANVLRVQRADAVSLDGTGAGVSELLAVLADQSAEVEVCLSIMTTNRFKAGGAGASAVSALMVMSHVHIGAGSEAGAAVGVAVSAADRGVDSGAGARGVGGSGVSGVVSRVGSELGSQGGGK